MKIRIFLLLISVFNYFLVNAQEEYSVRDKNGELKPLPDSIKIIKDLEKYSVAYKYYKESELIPEQSPNKFKNGKRDGKWIIWFDKNWYPTDNSNNTSFYREITFQNGQPVGKVIDYYRSRKKQFEGELLSYEPEINNGWCIWYFENGNKSSEGNYIKGKKEGKYSIYYENGKIEHAFQYDQEMAKAKGLFANQSQFLAILKGEGNYKTIGSPTLKAD